MNKFAWKPLAVAVLPLLTLSLAAQEKQDEKSVPAARLAAPAAQQGRSQEDLIKLRDEKMSLEVFKKAPWTFDYDKARADAKKEGKPIFVYFSRSYAH